MITYLDEATRQAAVRYLTRSGNDDVIAALGLDLADDLPPNGLCPTCGNPLAQDGRKVCRRRSCAAGPTARGVAR